MAPFPLQDPHLAAQTPLFISLHREKQGPPPPRNPVGISVPRLGLRKSIWFVQQLPLPTPPAPETLSERRKTHSERLPKYQSAVQSPGEERFSSPAEAAVNKHGTCFISCQGCPLLSTDLTPAPRQKKSQELEAHQQQTVPPYLTGNGVGSRSCLLRGNGRHPGEERCQCCTRRKTAEQIPELAQHKGTLGERLHHTARVLLSKAQLQTDQL